MIAESSLGPGVEDVVSGAWAVIPLEVQPHAVLSEKPSSFRSFRRQWACPPRFGPRPEKSLTARG